MAVVRVVAAGTVGLGVLVATGFLAFTTLGGTAVAAGAFGPDAGRVTGLNADQLAQARRALSVADDVHAPPLAVLAMVCAALGESNFMPIPNGGGSKYAGVFQADPANIAMDDTETQARSFLRGGKGFQAGGAITLATRHPAWTPGLIATLVEAGGMPAGFYDTHRSQAERIIAAWSAPKPGGQSVGAVTGADWLAVVPGTTFQCDQRIVPDVVALTIRYHLQLTACYAATGHEAGGEHPLGLAVDVVPAPPASWGMLDKLARDMGWTPGCAYPAGCPGPVFRFIGWNGYPGHGDPVHAGGNAHLHLSWAHGPGDPAESVRVLG